MSPRKKLYALFEHGQKIGLEYHSLRLAMIALDDLQTEAARAGRACLARIMSLETVPRPPSHEELQRQRPFVRLARAIRDLPDVAGAEASWIEDVLRACRSSPRPVALAMQMRAVADALTAQVAKPVQAKPLRRPRKRK